MSKLFSTVSGQGQPLVLLHGWGFSSQIWLSLLPQLTERYQVTLIDLPGHGRSELCANDTDAMLEMLVQIVPPQAIWVGWSLGGLIALMVAKKHPEFIRQLLLVASTPRFSANAEWAHGLAPELLDQFGSQLQKNTETTLMRFIALQTMGSPNARQETRELTAHIQQHLPSKAGLEWGLNLLNEIDMRDTLETLRCPVNALFGARDTLVSLALAEYLPQKYPRVKTAVLTQAAHMPFFSHPELFMQWLNESCNTTLHS